MNYHVTVESTFDSAHRLSKHLGLCAFVHGHTYRVKVTLSQGFLGTDDMVVDFSPIKQLLRTLLSEWDHALLLNEEDPLVELLRDREEVRLVVMQGDPTAEKIAETILIELRKALEPENPQMEIRRIEVWETPTSKVMVDGR